MSGSRSRSSLATNCCADSRPNRPAQEAAFTLLCQASLILPLTDQVVERAAALYGDLHRQGALLPDADLLIAATALEAQCTLVTNNLAHFQRIPNLVIETWKR